MENKVRDGMQSLRSYMDRAGLRYNIQSFGCSYFKNVEPVKFSGVSFTFGIDPKSCRDRQKVEAYIKRSGKYEIFHRYGYPGFQCFSVALRDDLEALRLYHSFSDRSVSSWEAEVHMRRDMGIYDPAVENDLAAGIMEYWEEEYKSALAARAEAV